MEYLKGLGREALKYVAGIGGVILFGFLITICTAGCAVVSPIGYVAFMDRPAYAYRAPAHHYHHYHHRGRPVAMHGHVPHGKQMAAHTPHGKKAVGVKKGGRGRGRGRR